MELVRGPKAAPARSPCGSESRVESLPSGKYLIKFFSLFFFPLLHTAPDRIWVWGQQARRTQRKKRNVKGWDTLDRGKTGLEGLEETDTLGLTSGLP